MATNAPVRIKTITEFHRFRELPPPMHPLVSVINYGEMQHSPLKNMMSWVTDYYSISLKHDFNAKMKYGQQECDFDEGTMFFMAPGQVFKIEIDNSKPAKRSGWILLIHPDFFWNTPLAKTIKQYEYFDYSVFEALFVSDKEEAVVGSIMQNIQQECRQNLDRFSQNIIIAQIELLLSYAERFYNRQFITRKVTGHKMLEQLEKALDDSFTESSLDLNGIPTVQHIADALNVSPNYLSSLLKALTGQSTQQHIHDRLIERAKQKLSATALSVSEIAYELGFEHPQSFSKLFKTKTSQSPLEFRKQFN